MPGGMNAPREPIYLDHNATTPLLPEVVARLAPIWPAYHLSQIALKAIDADARAPLSMHLAVLLGFTAVFGFLAHRRLSN